MTLDGLSYSPPSLFCQSTKTRRIGTDDFKSCAASICPCEPSRSLLGRVLLQCWVSSDIFDCSNYATWNNVHLYFILYYFWTLTIPPSLFTPHFTVCFYVNPIIDFYFEIPQGLCFPSLEPYPSYHGPMPQVCTSCAVRRRDLRRVRISFHIILISSRRFCNILYDLCICTDNG